MKKYVLSIFVLILVMFSYACTKDKECVIECDDVVVMIGDSKTIIPSSNANKAKYQYSVEGDAISVNENGAVTTNHTGDSKVTITCKGYRGSKTINVYVGEEGFQIRGENKLIIENKMNLTILFFGLDEDTRLIWRSNNNDVARVANGEVTGIGFGKATLTARYGDYSATFEVEVIRPEIERIDAKDQIKVEIGGTYNIEYDVYPHYSLDGIKIIANDDKVSVSSDNLVTMNKVGTSKIKLVSLENENVVKEVELLILESECPKFEMNSEYEQVINLNYGDSYDLLKGLNVIDNADGDIKAKVTFDVNKVYAYGEHVVTLEVSDLAGNVSTFDRLVNTTWQYHTKFIGHSGSYYGVPNTEEAFLYAASVLHYQALECDLHMTKDGIFVTNHDSYLTTTDENGEEIQVTITQHTYEELVKYTLTEGKYTGHICTFERYLEICKEYGLEAIIELKTTTGISDSSQSNMPVLIKFIQDHGMWDKTIFLTYSRPIMTWIRSHGYNDVGIQYLVQGGDNDDVLNFCKKYNCMLSVNVTYGQSVSDAYIKKYHDAGIKISTWTFSGQYSQVQEWIDKGVEYVTCDIHVMEKLELK